MVSIPKLTSQERRGCPPEPLPWGPAPLRLCPHSIELHNNSERGVFRLHLADQEMRPREGLPEPSQHVTGLQGCHSLHSLCVRAFPGAFSISDSQTPMFESPGDLVKTDLDPITLRDSPRFCVSNKLPGGTPAASSLNPAANHQVVHNLHSCTWQPCQNTAQKQQSRYFTLGLWTQSPEQSVSQDLVKTPLLWAQGSLEN